MSDFAVDIFPERKSHTFNACNSSNSNDNGVSIEIDWGVQPAAHMFTGSSPAAGIMYANTKIIADHFQINLFRAN